MKIAMVGWEYPPFKVGGLGTHCYGITRAFSEMGIQIDFYMPKHSSGGAKGSGSLRIIEIGATAISPYDRPYESRFDEDFYQAVNRYNRICANSVKGSYDVIHFHDWLTVQAGIALKYKLGKPMILTVHSTEYDRSGGICPNKWFIDIEREGMMHADRIIAVSHFTKRILIEKYGVPESKIRVIHNAVTPIGEGEKQRIVLFLGRLTIQKGPEFFLRAAKRVLEKESCLFVLAGSGEMLPRLIELALHLGIGRNVMFTGPLSEEEVRHIYRIASVYVLPSVSEPFGITALEAITAGTPVIVSKTAGVSEVLTHCLNVDFWDVDEMANKIIALLRYGPLRKTMMANAKREVEFFTWERTARKTLEVYREVI
ncbi:MAG TPA: glycosyltransferase family 1 protein [Euryarchaeota archaeon]|nr:glycosyltransferase family 1 protein [Euryarchaeota archaeon]